VPALLGFPEKRRHFYDVRPRACQYAYAHG